MDEIKNAHSLDAVIQSDSAKAGPVPQLPVLEPKTSWGGPRPGAGRKKPKGSAGSPEGSNQAAASSTPDAPPVADFDYKPTITMGLQMAGSTAASITGCTALEVETEKAAACSAQIDAALKHACPDLGQNKNAVVWAAVASFLMLIVEKVMIFMYWREEQKLLKAQKTEPNNGPSEISPYGTPVNIPA